MAAVTPDGKPRVLIVDDDDEAQSGAVSSLFDRGCIASALHPEQVSVEDVRESDLVLVDYNLSDWPERDGSAVARAPRTGISLLAVLRDLLSADTDRPVGFALNTTRFGDLPTVLPQPVTKHALARANNFEWVFDKRETADLDSIRSLAQACQMLPDDWHESDVLESLRHLVDLPDQNWTDLAVDHMLRCRPPVHELSTATDGLAVVRWILHRILPYPCFLMGPARLAVRLGIPLATLEELMDPTSGPGLAEAFSPVRYSGVLADFAGSRWWAAGIEAVLWDSTSGRSLEPVAVREFVESVAGTSVEFDIPRFPVLAVDEEYGYVELPVEIERATRIQPDDWPPYADDAWTETEVLATSHRLQALVHPDDR